MRVYAGGNCASEIYVDDGRSFAYQKGMFLRDRFTCEVTPDTLRVTIGKREGAYPAWWKQMRIEIYGWTPSKSEVRLNGAALATRIDRGEHNVVFDIPNDGNPSTVELQ